jgi:hypothetical protein
MKVKYLARDKTRLLSLLQHTLPGLQIKSVSENTKVGDMEADLVLTAVLKGRRYTFVCELKSRGSPSQIIPAIAKFKETAHSAKATLIVYAPYISERSADICRKNGVGFIDLEGNTFLSFGDILVDRRLPRGTRAERRQVGALFSGRATRIIRVLLENAKRKWLVAELALEAGVSIGYASDILRALVDQGYVSMERRKGLQLEDPAGLLDRWASVYDFNRNEVLSYYTFEKDFGALFGQISQVSDAIRLQCGLTLLSGASLVAPYMARFSDVHLYVQGNVESWREHLDLREVEGGANIHLVLPYDDGVFYALRQVEGIPVIGKIQLYLDLYGYPARGKEQAEHLRGQLIGF